jgi:hypothetical protein
VLYCHEVKHPHSVTTLCDPPRIAARHLWAPLQALHGVEGGNDALMSDETTRAVANNNAAAISLALTATAATAGPAHAAAAKAAKAAAKKLAGMLEDGANVG